MRKMTPTAPREMGGTMASMRNVRCDEMYNIAPTSVPLIQQITHDIKTKEIALTASKRHHYSAEAI
jgi:hypothetical protein